MFNQKIIKDHGLSDEEYQKIVEILGRHPNLVELGMYSVLWSEHCSYKSSKIYLKEFPTSAPWVIQGPGENAGIIDLGDDLALVMKMESHNHPSAIEPFQGAATGVGGIVRDIFTMGARPVASLNSLRFGPLNNPKNKFLFSGVVGGISSYGNCIGVPTVGGEVYFDDCYNENPLVNVMCVGIVKKVAAASNPAADLLYGNIVKAAAEGEGNPVLYFGSATGRDGIHGATFASAELEEDSEHKRPSVQVGDPFTEKLLIEASLELIKNNIVLGMQDMGAAGLTSSSSEMATKAKTGIELDISLVPRREANMNAYEIMLSESQERMLAVIKKDKIEKAKEICQKWGLNAVVIGKVGSDGMLRIKEKGEIVAEVPAASLGDGPKYKRPLNIPAYIKEKMDVDLTNFSQISGNYSQFLLKILASPNIASKKWVFEQYDHMVQTNTFVLPGHADAALCLIKGSSKMIALTTDGNSRYCYLDPLNGGKIAVAEASRNLAVVGAKPLALTDCLNFGNPEKPEVMWQFKEAVKGIAEACKELNIAVISGNVSFYNETNGEAIYPTPVIGMVGVIEDSQAATMNFKQKDDIIILLGTNKEEIGASEFLKLNANQIIGPPPSINLQKEKTIQSCTRELVSQNLINAAHDCSEGGLALALAEMTLFSDFGAQINLEDEDISNTALLFGETQSRIIITTPEEKLETVKRMMHKFKVPFQILGRTQENSLEISKGDKVLVELSISQIKDIYLNAMGKLMT